MISEARKEYVRKWKNDHLESVAEYNSTYNKMYREKHRSKLNEYLGTYYQNNKSKFRDSFLQRKFGISLEQYNKMFADQKGCCGVCGRHQSEFKRALSVDHNHGTGQIRELLCRGCNTGLGNFNEDPTLLDKAKQYLSKWETPLVSNN